MYLCKSVVKSLLLYSAHVFGLRYLDILETVQLDFLKRSVSLPKCCPSAFLRLELGAVKTDYFVFTAAWKMVIRFLQMEETRLPNICLRRLVSLHLSGNQNPRFNWVSQFDVLLNCIGLSELWLDLNHRTWLQRQDYAFMKFALYLKNADVIKHHITSSHACKIIREPNDPPFQYVLYRCPLAITKIFIQFRLASNYNIRFTYKNLMYTIRPNGICTYCKSQTSS